MSLQHVLNTCHVSSVQVGGGGAGGFMATSSHLLNDLRAVFLACHVFIVPMLSFLFYYTQSCFLFQMLHLLP